MTETALIIGEALVDIVSRPDGSTRSHPGGSPANVALGLARLGRSAELLTRLGADAHGDSVRAHLEQSGVRLVPAEPSESTSTAIATLDDTGAASYQFNLVWAVPADAAPSPAPMVVHTGSVAAVLAPGADDVRTIVERSRATATITYDPNARPGLMGERGEALAAVERMVALADVVKASDEDLAWLRPGEDIAAIARDWLQRGPSLVVVTRGADGVSAWCAAGEFRVPPRRVTVADTVGAGDSLMGGLIDGLWEHGLLGADRRDALAAVDGPTVEAILSRCAAIAAITVSRAGANPPTRMELETFLGA